MKPAPLRLGVNVDHVATLRNARGGARPDPLACARAAVRAGADGITIHLREDRRHIRDEDAARIAAWNRAALNLEIAPTAEMTAKALRLAPRACCLVPERRAEITTERGLRVDPQDTTLRARVGALAAAGTRVSLFIDAEIASVEAAHALGAQAVELHTGAWAHACARGDGAAKGRVLRALVASADRARALGLEAHAGHGLDNANLGPVAAIGALCELNIGHAIVADALERGFTAAVAATLAVMRGARGR